MGEYTLVCFVYGWAYNYITVHTSLRGVVKIILPKEEKAFNPLVEHSLHSLVSFFFPPPPPTMCMWHIQDEQQRDISGIAW